MLHEVYFGLGSNLGDKEANLNLAIEKIEEQIGEVFSISAFYITDPVGFDSENKFYNAVCASRTTLSVENTLEVSKGIEKEIGRLKKSVNKQYTDRIIDIDILFYDDLILETENLIVPHPELHLRDFVLEPLKEIAPQLIHPIFEKEIKDL